MLRRTEIVGINGPGGGLHKALLPDDAIGNVETVDEEYVKTSLLTKDGRRMRLFTLRASA